MEVWRPFQLLRIDKVRGVAGYHHAVGGKFGDGEIPAAGKRPGAVMCGLSVLDNIKNQRDAVCIFEVPCADRTAGLRN